MRVLNSPLYPFDYSAAVDEIASAVREYARQAAGEVDLSAVVADLDHLSKVVARWTADASKRASSGDADARRRANRTMRRLARILVPLNYARGERFDHDAAVKFPAVPRLESSRPARHTAAATVRLTRVGSLPQTLSKASAVALPGGRLMVPGKSR